MEEKNPITIEATVNAPIEKVWEYWNTPIHIEKWAFADDSWEAYGAENDLRTGGRFKTTMAAKDKSAVFDFGGTYTNVVEHEIIEYEMDDKRHVAIKFETTPSYTEVSEGKPQGTKITQTFDPENENPRDFQQQGWQSILENFKKYVENN